MVATQKLQLEVIDCAYVITRMFDAPRSLVYKAWTDPAHFAKWWGPHAFTNPDCSIDLRTGGKFLVAMTSPEGERNPLKGEFKEIIPNEKIVLQMYTDDHLEAWHKVVNEARGLSQDAPAANPLTTVTFEDVNGKTKLTVEQRFENNRDRDAFIRLGTGEGWAQSFVKMDSLLATLATDDEIIIIRELNAPLSLVWKAWSSAEHVAKWWGPNGFTNTFTVFDLRPGGQWMYTMHGPDGTDYPNWMGFEEVVPQERITYAQGSKPNDPDAFHGEVTFSEVEANKTRLVLRLRVASTEVRAGMFEFGAFEGGDQTLSRLDAFLQNM